MHPIAVADGDGELPELSWWIALPLDRPIALGGASLYQLETTIETMPPDAPSVLVIRELRGNSTFKVVSAVVGELDNVARLLYPAWLSGAEDFEGQGPGTRDAVRSLASRRALEVGLNPYFLADLAVRAIVDQPYRGTLVDDVRAEALLSVITQSYRRSAMALLIAVPETASDAERSSAFQAAAWLSAHGRVGVWLVESGDIPAHIPLYTVRLGDSRSDQEDSVSTSGTPELTVRFPSLSGRPHPRSSTEQRLEASLQRLRWADGRHWNYKIEFGPLINPIWVDLAWPNEKCIVEIDGGEHRLRRNYDRDRRRDNRLARDGYVVLRFTNDRIYHDLAVTLRTIEEILHSRREP